MQVKVKINDIYYIGEKEPKPIVITLENSLQKHDITTNEYKLKDLENQGSEPFYINEHWPIEISEKKKRE